MGCVNATNASCEVTEAKERVETLPRRFEAASIGRMLAPTPNATCWAPATAPRATPAQTANDLNMAVDDEVEQDVIPKV